MNILILCPKKMNWNVRLISTKLPCRMEWNLVHTISAYGPEYVETISVWLDKNHFYSGKMPELKKKKWVNMVLDIIVICPNHMNRLFLCVSASCSYRVFLFRDTLADHCPAQVSWSQESCLPTVQTWTRWTTQYSICGILQRTVYLSEEEDSGGGGIRTLR